MRKVLLFFVLIFSIYLFFSLFYLNKVYFLSPIDYKRDYIIRKDAWGDGAFLSRRSNGTRQHAGIDLLADAGTPVRASRSGKVRAAAQSKGMGNYIIIQDAGGFKTVYGHLHEIFVKNRHWVRQGQVIGTVGKTGNANKATMQAHLHFEIRKGKVPQDPLEYLP